MMLGVFTIVDPAAQQCWLAARTLVLGAGSLALLGGFIVRQKTAWPCSPSPLRAAAGT